MWGSSNGAGGQSCPRKMILFADSTDAKQVEARLRLPPPEPTF